MKTPLLPVNPALSRSPLITCLVVAVVVLALQLWLFQPIMLGFSPTLDEIPLQVASTAIAGPVNPWLWITHGFEGFYVPYPEWPGPANDFWRPLVNVLYWLRYQLSGEHLSSALLVGYLAHAAIVGIVCFVALRLFRLSPLAAFGAVAIAALNPAYVYHSMLDPYHVPRGHDWHSVLLHGRELLINLAWWAALVAAIVVAYRAWGRHWLTQQPEPWLIGLVFALGNLVAVLLLPATELRYAYFWFALGPAAVFAAWSRRPAGIAVAATLSVALLVPQVSSLADSLSDASLASYRAARQSARQLTQLLAALPSTVHTVYLLDDLAVQSSSPEYFARFSGFHGRLVLINNITSIRGCIATQLPGQRYRLHRQATTTVLEYQAPECFEKVWNGPPLSGFDQEHFIKRGQWMSYHFPELSLPAASSAGAAFDYDPGRRWTVGTDDPACQDAAACAWIGLDPVNWRYYRLAYEAGSGLEPGGPAGAQAPSP